MKKTALLLTAFLLSSCMSTGSEHIKDIDFVRETMGYYGLNKQSVEGLFGMPSSAFVKDGKEVYEYKYISVYNNPASYIPFVGLFFAPDKYLANYLYVTFDRFGNVETYEALSDTGDYPPEKAF